MEVPYTDEEREIHSALRTYGQLRAKRSRDNAESMAIDFVMKTLKKRLFSSPAAFITTLDKHKVSLQTAKKKKGAAKPSIGILKREIDRIEEDYADDEDYDEATVDAVDTASRLFSEPSDEELGLLKKMRDWAERACAQNDSKCRLLIAWLKEHIRPNKQWSDQRVIIFTEYRATQKWLSEVFATEGFSGQDRLMTMYGGMDSKQREVIKAAFQSSPDQSPVRILLATDAASEGIDLQNFCSKLIHYEIPWNPNRLTAGSPIGAITVFADPTQNGTWNLPAYGGNLFDPDRFPFLEGRQRGTCWKETLSEPLPINNRTVLHLLEALQVLQIKLPGGGHAEPRKLSFRELNIEQIGHVYEGLLDHTAKRATEPVLGLSGTRNNEPEIPLTELEELAAKDEEKLHKFLKKQTGRASISPIKKMLAAELDDLTVSRFRTACQGDEELWQRMKPFAGLVRMDTFDYPVVIPKGSVFVTAGTDRRSSGTHYTPRSLTEPIVQYTLEPLVYEGPAEGRVAAEVTSGTVGIEHLRHGVRQWSILGSSLPLHVRATA